MFISLFYIMESFKTSL